MIGRISHILKSRFISHVVIYGIGALFLKGVSFLLIPLYTSVLLPEEYGRLELLLTFSSILEIVLSLGLYQVLYVFYFHKEGEERKKLIDQLISIYLVIPTGLYIILSVVMYFLYEMFFDGTRLVFVYMSMLGSYLNFFVGLFVLVLKLSQQARRVTILQVSAGVISITLNIILVYFLKVGIGGILLSNLISLSFMFFIGQYGYFSKFRLFYFHISKDKLKEYLSLSLPFVPGALAYWVLNSFNRWIVVHELGLVALGIFSVAVRFGSIMEPLVIQPFLSAYSPRTLKGFSQNRYDQKLLYMYPLVIVGFLLFGLLVQWLAGFMIDERYYGALQLIPVFFLAASFALLAQMTSLLLLFRKQVKKTFTSILLGSIAGSIVCYVLAGLLGVIGVAIGYLAGNMVWAGFVLFFYTKERKKISARVEQ